MVTENLQQIKVSVSSLVVRNGIYQAVLEYYDENGKRQQPWRSTGLKEQGNKKQAMLKLEYAFAMDIIPNNPADKVKKPKVEQYIGSYYTQTELNTLFEKSKGDPLEVVVLITAFYGLRRSEVLGLKWDSLANLYAHLDVNSKKLSADALVNALKFTDAKKKMKKVHLHLLKNN